MKMMKENELSVNVGGSGYSGSPSVSPRNSQASPLTPSSGELGHLSPHESTVTSSEPDTTGTESDKGMWGKLDRVQLQVIDSFHNGV